MNLISSSGLSLIYNSANFVDGGTFDYSASFNFHNEETCGPRRVSSPLGNKNNLSPTLDGNRGQGPAGTCTIKLFTAIIYGF